MSRHHKDRQRRRPCNDGEIPRITVPPALRQEWQEYPRRNAVPRVTLDLANLPRSKVKVEFANL